jgi:glucosamine--fructose-6-phosphate aminotransferase (isomerizing)
MQKTGKKPDFMLSEMLEQPRITDSIFNDINLKNIGKTILESDIKRIYITGSGDSYCASWFGSNLVSKWRPEFYIQHYAPFEFVNYLNPKHLKKSVVIGISVSGNTPRVVEAIRFAKKHNAQTIGITDNPQGKVAQESDFTLYTHTSPPETLETSSYVSEGAKNYVGYHHDVAQTKTYLANLAVQSVFLAYLSQEEKSTLNQVKQAFQLVKKAADQRNYFLNIFNNLNSTVDNIIFVSSGPNGPTGLFGAYKMYEFTLNGFACDIEEYCHTKYFITTDKSLVIFIASDSFSLDRILEIEPVIRNIINAETIILANSNLVNTKAAHYILIETPKVGVLSPLVYTIPIEFFSYSIARNKGFDTNQFRGGQETEKYVSGSYRTIRQSKINY